MSRTNLPNEQNMLRLSHKRIEKAFYLLLLPLGAIGLRLVTLQGLPSAKTRSEALPDNTFVKTQELAAPRGAILASDGTALAVTIDEYDIAANPRAVKGAADKAKMAKSLATAIGGDEAKYQTLLGREEKADGSKSFYVKLARHIDAEHTTRLRQVMGPQKGETRQQRRDRKEFWSALTLEPSPRRHYPLGEFAPQLLGFTNKEGGGQDGLERAWNTELAGRVGEVKSEVDARERPIPGFVQKWKSPVPGQTIVTTIDPQIQADADEVMTKLSAKFKPNFAVALVMKPKTGEVVAMSTAPLYDLNHKPRNVAEIATNRCVNFSYEPGSTFKIITAAAAVEKVPDWQSKHFFCNGAQMVGKHNMHCWISSTSKHRHGDETLAHGIRDSCNFAMYGFAKIMGAQTMLDYAKKFGLNEPVHFAGLAENDGTLPRNDPKEWSAEQLANFSFGQGMMISPLQLMRVAGTVANDGVMMQPMLVKEIRDERGRVVKTFQPQQVRRVIAPQTALEVTKMMELVTTEGTATKFVWVPGYESAGKTGSAQKADGPRGYAAGKFISSFIGFLPSRRPEYVILIMADEPHGSHWGSEVCGPAYAEIARRAMLTLRLREGTRAPAPSAALMEKPVLTKGH